MRRKGLLIGVGVLILCVVAIAPVLAQGTVRNPVYATIEYVDQEISQLTGYVDQQVAELYAYVDEQIGGGGGSGPDFDLPVDDDWIVAAYTFSNPYGCISEPVLTASTDGCCWNGLSLTGGSARAMVSHDGEVFGYGTGSASYISFPEVGSLPPVGETIDLDIWVFWMGTERQASVSRPVTEPQYEAPAVWGGSLWPEDGYAPLSVRFTLEAGDSDPCDVLTSSWDFGDGGTAVAEMQRMDENTFKVEVVHVYESPGIYYPVPTVTDLGGMSYSEDIFWLEVYE